MILSIIWLNGLHSCCSLVDTELRYRYSEDGDGEYDPTPVLYAMDVSRDTLDTVLEFLRVGRLWCLILMKRILGRSILCM